MATTNDAPPNSSASGTPIPSTMCAWQFSSTRGGIEKNLHLNDAAPVPAHDAKALGSDKVLVKVLAAGINPVDCKIAELPVVGRLLYRRDATPGSDFAGVVARSTAKATSTPGGRGGEEEGAFSEGQLVFGRLNQPVKHGTLEEYIVVPRAQLVRVPEGVDPVNAAGVGVAGLTAYQCIQPFVQPGRADRVFINGGSGGTGVWGIQIAKALGCHVTTSCSGANAELCKNLGADEVIDYRSTNVVEALKKAVSCLSPDSGPGSSSQGGAKFDLVVDNVGSPAELYWQGHHYMSDRARYVQIGVEPGTKSILDLVMKLAWPGFLGGGKRKFEMLLVKDNTQQMAQIADWMRQGKVKTVFHDGSPLPIEDGARAFAILKTHRAKGKLVVKMNRD
ncbi:uncharacterized protein A1O9_05033 [Exophiala aquamarina CBS 119918]|uniref:Enoyl reductase (ER) domain-containing protein n=1 Tax=Exophiala aquamarina CBS 119918 TaxID=1182545 RepID=A0A072PLG7_9EURO|nr:uncharacterized protein A1O9_05033 [Exophiala aquamarina CBS 119918]KEF60183.1 hypothetical protein A1O9_05033 [Exophiala aquamarina CBS 119918]